MGALLSTWDDPPVWTISLLVRPLLLSLANTPPSLAEADAGLDVLIQATVASPVLPQPGTFRTRG